MNCKTKTMRPKFKYTDLNTLTGKNIDFQEWDRNNNIKEELGDA